MISIGNMAKTFGLLPSQVAAQATSYDLMIMDVMTTWENHKNDPQNMDNYKTEDLEKLVKEMK